MRTLDRAILAALAAGVWALVALQLAPPAGATTQVAEMPLQQVFNTYLTTALAQARSVANGCRVKGDIRGTQLDAQIAC